MSTYAAGKYSYGFCDRCGLRYDLAMLKGEFVRGVKTGLLTCPECHDPDHPQNWQGAYPHTADAQALKNPRPDTGQDESRRLFSWDPVGHQSTVCTGVVGRVTVVTT